MSTDVIESESVDHLSISQHLKRKSSTNDLSTTTTKRSKLQDMIFYDGNRHPAAVLHDLRPEICSEKYSFESEQINSKQTRFRCTLTIDQNVQETITAIGFGRSKQSAKNMAAQQALMKLYPTYRPPVDAILSEDCDMYQQTRYNQTRPASLENDPRSLIDSIRKHLTTKSISIKSPLQLFNEIFINNPRLNSSTLKKNRIELIDNDENLVLVRVTAMDQHFWGVSAAKNVAQNDACQQAIETLCNVSFKQAKEEFIQALISMKKITLTDEINIDNNNNNNDSIVEEQSMTTESILIPGVSSSFLMPNEES